MPQQERNDAAADASEAQNDNPAREAEESRGLDLQRGPWDPSLIPSAMAHFSQCGARRVPGAARTAAVGQKVRSRCRRAACTAPPRPESGRSSLTPTSMQVSSSRNLPLQSQQRTSSRSGDDVAVALSSIDAEAKAKTVAGLSDTSNLLAFAAAGGLAGH